MEFNTIFNSFNNEYLGKVPLGIINEGHIDAISSIRKARNCIVHRQGVIDEKIDCENDKYFELKWFYTKSYVILSDGLNV